MTTRFSLRIKASNAWRYLLLLLATAFAPLAFAVNYCVTTGLELNSALIAASTSNTDDEIRLVTGSFTLSEINLPVRGALTIRGGYPAGCSGFGSLSAQSTISNLSTTDFDLSTRFGNLVIDRVIFSGWRQVVLSDAFSATGAPGEFRVQRSRFSNQSRGLVINTRRFDVRVENSIFDGYANDGLRIASLTSGEIDMNVLVQFNTIVNPSSTVSSTAGLLLDGRSTAFASLRIYNNVINGNPLDLRVFGQQALLRYNFWNTQDFQFGGGLNGLSGNNRSGDPGLTASPSFRPIVPSSQLINNGVNIASDLPTFDFSGGPRFVGTKPDIGAFETSLDDSASIVVTSNADSGTGSLRSAITSANTNPGFKKITFNIPGSCPQQINLSTTLPAITQPVAIEAYSQPGSVTNNSGLSFEGTVCVFLVGSNNIASGLRLQTQGADDEMSVRGMGFYGFSSEALRISGPGKGNVRGNIFGTGLTLFGQNFADAVIRVIDAPGTIIGTDNNADMNVIGGGDVVGVDLAASASGTRIIEGNLIGINRNGSTGLPNGIGVRITDSDADYVTRNIISFNTSHAVTINGSATRSVVFSNKMGFSLNTAAASGNGGNGVRILGGSAHVIRNNAISKSAGDGIVVLAAARATKLQINEFDGNQRQAIDLSPDGVNPIDLDVGQTGANDQQNYPLITDAVGSSTQGEVALNFSSANGTYGIELFANPDCFPSVGGFSQAQQFLGAANGVVLDCATAVANCSKLLRIPVTNQFLFGALSLAGAGITAIAIDEEGNTSEVSACRLYRQGDNLFKDGFE
jgi:trimeric autotransporter adhesin